MRVLNIVQLEKNNVSLNIHSLQPNDTIPNSILEKYRTVFSNNLGFYNNKKLKLYLKSDATPVFCKPRPVPFAMRKKLENEICRLEQEGIIEAVESSEWATPVVPVLKSNGEMRLCGDYKITVNPQLIVDKHPIPRVVDLLAELEKGQFFLN